MYINIMIVWSHLYLEANFDLLWVISATEMCSILVLFLLLPPPHLLDLI